MFDMIDVSGWDRVNTEQMGTKPKFWCVDPAGDKYLFKESRPREGEHWSEKLAAEIAGLLGLPHAEIELAVCDGKNGTISKNFLPPTPGKSLLHGNELLFEHDPNYPKHANAIALAQHTLSRILHALKDSGAVLPDTFSGPANVQSACDLFVGYLLLDALITNTDRHHANWAVITSTSGAPRRHIELAPTFDHASSLGRELSDERRVAKLVAQSKPYHPKAPARRKHTVVGYLETAPSRIYASEQDRTPLHPMQVLQQAAKVYRKAADAWIARLAEIPTEHFTALVDDVPKDTMSQAAKEFSCCMIELNRTALIERIFGYV